MAAAPDQAHKNAPMPEKMSLNELTKIPEREFERQFRDWMERDEVARSLQSKLRYDLITNFNKTNLGKRLKAETTTNRLMYSPMVLALNTLVAEFLYTQDCHFALSVFCSEVPFRNTLPDFEKARHFRFSEVEISDIMTAVCGSAATYLNVSKQVSKNYRSNASTSLLFYIIKALLEKTAEQCIQKVPVATNTSSNLKSIELSSSGPDSLPRRKTQSDINNLNFRYLNKYLVTLSKKVQAMTDHFENIKKEKQYWNARRQPRVRMLKSSKQRKFEDLNRSLERATENLKQIVNMKRKNKYVDNIVKAIEAMSGQFQKCAINFENMAKATPRSNFSNLEKSTSVQSMHPRTVRVVAASQTEFQEKSYSEWINEMRYTRNGQRFLDRVEKSLQKAMEKQRKELTAAHDIRMRHQTELLKIRYKQKLIENMYFHASENNEAYDEKPDIHASISEQFRQFELKHFDLLSKIYETEKENMPESAKASSNVESNQSVPTQEVKVLYSSSPNKKLPFGPIQSKEKSTSDVNSSDIKEPASNEKINSQHILSLKSSDMRNFIRLTVGELVEEERNVNQIVTDAKLRIRELEQEGNQLSEHFLGYLDRQRKQRLEARDAAQSVWNDYLKEREKMRHSYSFTQINSDMETLREIENIKNQILNSTAIEGVTEKDLNKNNEISKSENSSSKSSAIFPYTNPILKAKDDFFERDRQFKEENERRLNLVSQPKDTKLSALNENLNDLPLPTDLSLNEPLRLTLPLFDNNITIQDFNKPLSETTDLYSLWTGSRRNPSSVVPTSTTTKMDTRVTDLHFLTSKPSTIPTKPTTTTITTTIATDGHNSGGINSKIALTSQWKQSHQSVNKSQQRHEPSTIAVSTASMDVRKQIKTATIEIPTTTTTTTPNKNNNNVDVEGHDYGAEEAPKAHCDYNKRNANEKKNGKNNNNNNNNHNNNKNTKNNSKGCLENTEESGNLNSSGKKAVLLQSMARIEKLFDPQLSQRNQNQQQQKQHQQQRTVLDDVTEDDESVTPTPMEMEQQSNRNKLAEETKRKNKNLATNSVSTGNSFENVSTQYKNNLQFYQTTILETQQQLQQLQRERQQKESASIEIIGDAGRFGSDSNAMAITANFYKQQNQNPTTTKTSSSSSNKSIEVMLEWQQIGCGTMSGKSAFKEKGKIIESKGHHHHHHHEGTETEEAVAIEAKMNEPSNAVELEPGEVIEKDERSEALGLSAFKVPDASKQLELVELIESSEASARGTQFIAVSSQSSSEVQISSIGADDDALNVADEGVRNRNSAATEAGSNSDSDFWA